MKDLPGNPWIVAENYRCPRCGAEEWLRVRNVTSLGKARGCETYEFFCEKCSYFGSVAPWRSPSHSEPPEVELSATREVEDPMSGATRRTDENLASIFG